MDNKIFIYASVLFVVQIVFAEIIHVPTDKRTIQMGIAAARDGDTVLVAPGRYFQNIIFYGKRVAVGSYFLTSGDTTYISRTIIDGRRLGSVVTFDQQEDSNSVLSGFTITNGRAHGVWPVNSGGGIHCGYKTSPKLEYLRIVRNEATGKGGGIFCFAEAAPSITNCQILYNEANQVGGGMFFEYATKPKIENVVVRGNFATIAGGGIYFYTNTNVVIRNVTIVENRVYDMGGGIYFYDCEPMLMNVTICRNVASPGAGGGIFVGFISHPKLVNTILWNNFPEEIFFDRSFGGLNSITIAYSDIQGGKGGVNTGDHGTLHWLEGNLNLDPLFVNSAENDYNLTDNSPCIDAGIQDTTLTFNNHEQRIDVPPIQYDGRAPDMGAYEFSAPAFIADQHFLPTNFYLFQNYPNPFNSKTTISFQLPKSLFVELSIYDITGQLVKNLLHKKLPAGYHHTEWNAEDLSSGFYFYQLKTPYITATKKCLLLR